MSMNIQRFQAATAREALALARAAFGDDTLVLSNRQLANGVEVLAAAESDLSSFEPAQTANAEEHRPLLRMVPLANGPTKADRRLSNSEGTTQDVVRADTEQLAMSTLSFQDYVRERMLRRQQEEAGSAQPIHAPRASSTLQPAEPRLRAQTLATASVAPPAPTRAEITTTPALSTQLSPAALEPAATPDSSKSVMTELHSMKRLMEERFNTLAWLGQARQNPLHSHLMLKLVRAGYSAALARTLLEPIAGTSDAGAAVRDVIKSLERMLGVDTSAPSMTDEGGVFALIGATGVGKTTTVAKLASQCARTHGATSVGLVTLDSHRPGAHEQLRAFGRSLGVVAHLAHDRAALQELLVLLSGKKMILIDTPGMAPRDARRRELLDVLELPGVKSVLVLSAGAHGDTLDEIVRSFKSGGLKQAVLSKVDEAAKLGPALDTLMRHRLDLRGVANGQRVPDDWTAADGAELVRNSMRAGQRAPFDPGADDLDFYFSPAACAV